jgi:hypothetical protein
MITHFYAEALGAGWAKDLKKGASRKVVLWVRREPLPFSYTLQ